MKVIKARCIWGWYLELFETGRIIATCLSDGRCFPFWSNTSVTESSAPWYVKREVISLRDTNRITQRLHIAYRLGSLFAGNSGNYVLVHYKAKKGGRWKSGTSLAFVSSVVQQESYSS